MANDKTIHGRINCPCCGTENGVRITADKNGHPFGFCDLRCGLQLRIGGDHFRVSEFNKRHAKIAASMGGSPVSDTNTEQKTQTTTQKEEKPKTGFDLGL